MMCFVEGHPGRVEFRLAALNAERPWVDGVGLPHITVASLRDAGRSSPRRK